MPATSGSPTQISTRAATVAELESVESSQFQDGDMAWVDAFDGTAQTALFVADFNSTTARNGTTILYMRNSNPAYGGLAAGATPGRWKSLSTFYAAQPEVYVQATGQILMQTNPGAVVLTTPLLTCPAAGFVDVDAYFSSNAGAAAATQSFQLQASLNNGAFANVGVGGAGLSGVVNQTSDGAIVQRLAVAAGDTVVFRLWCIASAGGCAIDPGIRPLSDGAVLRARFFAS